MKALYVVGSCLQCNTSANMSHNGYVQGLLENGWQVDIIMENTSFGVKDNSLPKYANAIYYEYNSVSAARKIKDKFKSLFASSELSQLSSTEAASSDYTNNQPLSFKSKVRNLLKKCYYATIDRPNIYKLDLQWLKNASKFKSNTQYDIVISNSSPAASHKLVANLIKKNHINYKKWIQIWEDPWYYDLYASTKDPKILQEENNLLDQSDEIYYVSPLTLENQKKFFPDNAYKMNFSPLPYLVTDKSSTTANYSDKISFGYYGDYYSHVRNLKPFYDSLCITGAKGYIIGDTNENFASTENIKIQSRVTLDILNKFQSDTTVLINLCNLGGGQIPGKIYHYSATEKPIIFILDGSEEEKSKIIEYFQPYNRFMFCNNTLKDISYIMSQFLNGILPLKEPVLKDFAPKNVVKQILETNICCTITKNKD